jgi:hypothetical protein
MATFLTVNLLRAHPARAVPHGRAGDRVWPRAAPRSCPVLAARWLVGSHGRLTCLRFEEPERLVEGAGEGGQQVHC